MSVASWRPAGALTRAVNVIAVGSVAAHLHVGRADFVRSGDAGGREPEDERNGGGKREGQALDRRRH